VIVTGQRLSTTTTAPTIPVAIIGAGPYGLSIAAHLVARGVPFRIFGTPMSSWSTRMPKGMQLKSEGFASNLSDPQGQFTLERFCAERDLEYRPFGCPIPVEVMTAYGLAFQRQFVPGIEDKMVVGVELLPNGFAITLDDGTTATAGAIVVAVGIGHFRNLPPALSHLPPEMLTHSADHHDLSGFAGRDVTVIGGGSSAIDLAVLLKENGAQVRLVHRRGALLINPRPDPERRPMWHRIRSPMSVLGPGWRSRFCAEMPQLFCHLPERIRVDVAAHHIPAAAGWIMEGRVVGHIPLLLGHSLCRAEVTDDRVHLSLTDADGKNVAVATDHVIAATGYKPEIGRLSFLSEAIRSRLRLVANTPDLSSDFQSSVPRLFFAGPITLNKFGPVVRFVSGAAFTARRLAITLQVAR
jgi:thioredoxin reductase